MTSLENEKISKIGTLPQITLTISSIGVELLRLEMFLSNKASTLSRFILLKTASMFEFWFLKTKSVKVLDGEHFKAA